MTDHNMRELSQRRHASGFSLIEIMVGLVIGMVAIVIMLQMLSNADANKRNTAGGNDAQMNTAIALYNLEREIRMAGYGLSDSNILGCTLSYTPKDESTAITLSAIAPVIINPPTSQVPAGDANTDTLLVMYGSSPNAAEGSALTATSSTTAYTVTSPTSFVADTVTGDRVIAAPLTRPTPPSCALTLAKVTANSATNGTGGSTLTVSNGKGSLSTGSVVYNLGAEPAIRAYAIRKGILTMCDYTEKNCGNSAYATAPDPTVWVPVASNIVGLRAQYGRDTSTGATMGGTISQWDQSNPLLETDTGANAASPPIHCARARILAVRMALVGRSAAYDKRLEADGGLGNPTWSGSTAVTSGTPTNPTALTLDLSNSLGANNNSWKGYRYKALETTIPLRNMVWRGGDDTC